MGYSEVPTIYVSDMKWSFLSNGAQRCLSDLYISSSYYFKHGEYIEWIMVQCLNSPPGRYVSFVYHKQTLITIGINSFITAKFELLFISRKREYYCHANQE